MFKFKTIAIAALFALTIVGIFSLRAPAGPNALNAGSSQVDVTGLMSKAGNLPVEHAPEI